MGQGTKMENKIKPKRKLAIKKEMEIIWKMLYGF